MGCTCGLCSPILFEDGATIGHLVTSFPLHHKDVIQISAKTLLKQGLVVGSSEDLPLVLEHLYVHPALASQSIASTAPLKVTKITFCCPTTWSTQHVSDVLCKHPVCLWPTCLSHTSPELDATRCSPSSCLLTSSAKACLTLTGRLLRQMFLLKTYQQLSWAIFC